LALIVLCNPITLKVITVSFPSVTGLVGLAMHTAKVIGTFLLISCLNQSPENLVQPTIVFIWPCSSLVPVFAYFTPLDKQINVQQYHRILKCTSGMLLQPSFQGSAADSMLTLYVPSGIVTTRSLHY
jgi:hypothetical protein